MFCLLEEYVSGRGVTFQNVSLVPDFSDTILLAHSYLILHFIGSPFHILYYLLLQPPNYSHKIFLGYYSYLYIVTL